ncbi:MAG: hypothetical protein WBW33_37015, partial [Bryobacteraceae bacterium]
LQGIPKRPGICEPWPVALKVVSPLSTRALFYDRHRCFAYPALVILVIDNSILLVYDLPIGRFP